MKRGVKLLILLLLLGWLFYGIDLKLLVESLKRLNPLGIVLTFISVFISDLIISYRWYYLSHFQHPFKASVEANMLAFFLNIFAPAKLGDLSKIYYMQQEGYDAKMSASMFLLERFLDVIVLGFMILFSALFILPSKKAVWIGGVLLIVALIFLGIVFNYSLMLKLLRLIPFKKVKVVLYKILKATRTNLEPKRLVILFLLTLLVWGGYYLNNFVFFLTATDFDLSLKEIFIASTLAFAVSAIPITPGGIGTFQAAFILALGWFGISKEEALGASIVLQLLYILPATLYSLYLFWSKEFLLGAKNGSTTKL
ncbi:MAG: flippase-like domain-containing protein [Epsilonproteobacteria bacterium]|nr:flippase-like domain-containing protein [Campylobacterota bacterium]